MVLPAVKVANNDNVTVDTPDEVQCAVQAVCFLDPGLKQDTCDMSDWRSFGTHNFDSLRLLTAGVGPNELPPRKQFGVTVIWGIRPAKSAPWIGLLEETWRFDPDFEPSDPWAQRALHSMCTEMPESLAWRDEPCWVEDFRKWLTGKKRPFPSRNWDEDIIEWFQEDLSPRQNIWFVDGRAVATKISFTANMVYDAAAASILDYKQKWDSFLDERNRASACSANKAWHSAHPWVRAEAEIAVVNSLLHTIVISMVCGFVGMLAFTWDPTLSLLVLFLVLGVIIGLAFFMVVVMSWKIGPIEVISLVIFVGYSVTYSLHIAHVFSETPGKRSDNQSAEATLEVVGTLMSPADEIVDHRSAPLAANCLSCGGQGCSLCPEMQEMQETVTQLPVVPTTQHLPKPLKPTLSPRSWLRLRPRREAARERRLGLAADRAHRVRVALLRVGGATLSSAASTIGSNVFLLFCTLRIFTKLGAVVIAVTTLSCIFALLVLPAALLLAGPRHGPWCVRLAPRLATRCLALLNCNCAQGNGSSRES